MTVIAPTASDETGIAHALSVHPAPPRRREARRRRRGAALAARAAARRAELHLIRAVLLEARALLGRGWLQKTWFGGGLDVQPQFADAAPVQDGAGASPAACLVGAVVLASGGPMAVREQPTQRSLDLLWHTLHRPREEAVQWCPGPGLRTLQVQDLTRWNDTPERSLDEVLGLLDTAIGRLTRELQTDPAVHSGRGSRVPAQSRPWRPGADVVAIPSSVVAHHR
jgi:hypothetical protein